MTTSKCTRKQLWTLYMANTDKTRPVKSKATKPQIIAALEAIGIEIPVNQVFFNTTHADLVPAIPYAPPTACVGRINEPEYFGDLPVDGSLPTLREFMYTISKRALLSKCKKCKLYIDPKASKGDLVEMLYGWKFRCGRMVYPLGHKELNLWKAKEATEENIEELCFRLNCRQNGRTYEELLECPAHRPCYFDSPLLLEDRNPTHPQLSEREAAAVCRRANKCLRPRWRHNVAQLRFDLCERVGVPQSGKAMKQIHAILSNKQDSLKAPRDGHSRTFGAPKKTFHRYPSIGVRRSSPTMLRASIERTRVNKLTFPIIPIKEERKRVKVVITPGELVLDDEDMKLDLLELDEDIESREIDYPDHSDEEVEFALNDLVDEVICRQEFLDLIAAQARPAITIEETLEHMAILDSSFSSNDDSFTSVDAWDQDAIDAEAEAKEVIEQQKEERKLNCQPIMRLRGGGPRQESSREYGRYTAQMMALGRRNQIRPASSMIGQQNWNIIFSDTQRLYSQLQGRRSTASYAPGPYNYRANAVMNGLHINIPVNGPFHLLQPATKIELQAEIYENLTNAAGDQYEGMINRAEIVEIIITEQIGNAELDRIFNRDVGMSRYLMSFTQDCMDTDANCVVQMVFNKYQGLSSKYRVKNMTVEKIHAQFEQVCKNINVGITIQEIMEWADRFTDNVSMYAINPFDHTVFRKFCNRGRRSINLTFVQFNNHVYPVTCRAVQTLVANNEVLPSEDVVWQMSTANDFLATYDQALDSIKSEGKEYDVVIIPTGLETLINEIVKFHNVLIDNIKFNKAKITAFQHPLTGTIYVQSEDYVERRELCTKLHRQLDLENFRFANQSYAEIATTLFLHIVGVIPESSYTADALELSDLWSTAPINEGYMYHDLEVETHAYDATRFYATAAEDNTADFPVFNAFDPVTVYVAGTPIICGEYLIKEFTFHDVIFKSQLWGWNSVQELLDMKMITEADILLQRTSRTRLPGTIFKDFITRLGELLGDYPKTLVNTLIGTLNSKLSKYETGMITMSYEEALAHWAHRTARGEESTVNTVRHADIDTYHIRSSTEHRLKTDNCPLWRQIVSNSHISLIRMLKAITTIGSQVVAVRTDCVYIHRPKAILESTLEELKWHVVKEKTYTPTKNVNECDVKVLQRVRESGATHTLENYDVFILNDVEFPRVYFEQESIHDHAAEDIYAYFYPNRLATIPTNAHQERELDLPSMDVFQVVPWVATDDVMSGSMLITGDAGSGKSTLIRQLYRDYMAQGKIVKCLTFTNVARVNLQDNVQIEMDPEDVLTIDSWFGMDDSSRKPLVRRTPDVMIIDEFSQVNKAHMTKLYNLQAKHPTMILIFAGDIKQCVAVEMGDGIRYNWIENTSFQRMCNNKRHYKAFIEGGSRYSAGYHAILQQFTETGQLPDYFRNRPLDPEVELSMAFTNNTKDAVIKKKQEKRALDLGLPVSECRWFVGQWISIDATKIKSAERKLLKDNGVFNNARFKIHSLTETHVNVIIRGEPQEIKLAYIVPLYCSTVYKNQAITIAGDHVNIFEVERMDKNQVYTALSRVKDGNQIHLTYTDKVFHSIPFDNTITVYPKVALTKVVKLEDGPVPKIAMELLDGDTPARVLFTDEKMFKRICNRRNAVNKVTTSPKTQSVMFQASIKQNRSSFLITVRNRYDGHKQDRRVRFDKNDKDDIEAKFEEAQAISHEMLAAVQIQEPKQTYTQTNIKGAVADIRHVPIAPVAYQCNTEYLPAPIERVTSIRGPMASKDWYYKAEPVNVQEGCAVKWVVDKQVRGSKQTHFFSKGSREDIIETLEQSANKPTYMYEVLDHDVRLFADIDRDIEEEEKFNEESALVNIVRAVRLVASREGTNLDMDRFRFLTASNATKMSVHMTHLDCKFPSVTSQQRFWKEVCTELESNDEVWYIKNDKNGSKRECILDMGVYGRNRAMRTIFSQKPSKNNPLLPVGIDLQQLDGVVIEEYLVSTASKGDYTILTHDKVEARRQPRAVGGSAPRGDIPEAVSAYLAANPIFGYDCVNVQYFVGGVCRLDRNAPSYCNHCSRDHQGENACLLFNDTNRTVSFKCYRSNLTTQVGTF